MKAKHLFWGLLFISLGVLILVNNFSGICWDWISLWKLWPLVFILWGLAIIVKGNALKVLIAGLAGIVLALTLFASFKAITHLASSDFNIVFDDEYNSDYKYEVTDYSEPFTGNIRTAEFHFKAGAGTFTTTTDTTSNLFFAHTEGLKDNYSLTNDITGDNADLTMKMKTTRIKVGKNEIRNRVEMFFNPDPLWNLYFDIGASSMKLDLSTVKVRKLNVEMGAASFKVKLSGNTNRTDVVVKSGVSEVKISIPEDAGCEISTKGSLNSTDFYDFSKINSDLYRTGNFDTATNRIYIHIDSGVSSLKVDRYSDEW